MMLRLGEGENYANFSFWKINDWHQKSIFIYANNFNASLSL